MLRSTVVGLCLSSFSPAGAVARLDEGGMPRCVGDAATKRFLVFDWEAKELYRRDVHVYPTDSARACEHWESFLRFKDRDRAPVLAEGVSEYAGVTLDERSARALHQLRRGASVYREESSAAEFLTRNFVLPFDLQTNRAWTARYGVGFVSEVYSEWLRRRPPNAAFQASLLARANAVPSVKSPWLAPNFGERRVILYVKGLAHETKLAYRFGALAEDIAAMGIPIVTAQTAGYGDMRRNAESVKTTLRSLLAQGKDVILLTLSKGSTETAMALMDLQAELDGPPAPGHGVVQAWIAFSSVFQGSYIADYGTKFPLWPFVKAQMIRDLRKEGLNDIHDLSGVPQLASDELEKLLPDLRRRLPRTVLCYNVIGTPSDDGLPGDESMRRMTNEVARKQIRVGFGANDGFMEFPNSVLQEEWLPPNHLKILNLNGSHAILEGNFGGWRVADAEGRWRLLSGLMAAVLADVDGREPLVSVASSND